MPDTSARKENNRKRRRKIRSSRAMPKAGTRIVSVLSLLGIIFALTLFYLGSSAGAGQPVTVKIAPQSTTSQIAALLEEEGLIRSAGYFKLYAKYTGADRSLKPGKYLFKGTESLPEIISILQAGSPDFFSFTIPEGYTLEQIINLLVSKGIATKEELLAVMKDPQIEFPYFEELPEGPNRLEGFLFPDTYTIEAETSARDIIQLMLDRFSEIYTDEYAARAKELDLTTLEVVTLASIIEREAKKQEDRPLVSAVFHNRLEKGMLLQSCATVQYALGEVKPVLYNTDLQTESPYNTYLHSGLPPGPIAAPGEASLKAALYPAEVSYLYFVAKPDGSHVFSNTLKEHNEAKKKYIR